MVSGMEGRFTPVLDIVRAVQPLLMPHWGVATATAYKTERYNSPVTALDVEAELLLARELKKFDSSISFVGEEHRGDRAASKFWLVDPIDGTDAFMRGLPHCTTMLALIEEGKPQFSAIYNFVTDELYHAERGKGAYRNGERIFVSERTPPEAMVGLESDLSKEENMQIFKKLRTTCSFFKTMTAGHEFALVASGKIEGRICVDPFGEDYDFVPGALLVAEAGGVVANIGSRSYDYKNLNFIAANQPVFEVLTESPDAVFPLSHS